MPACRLRVYAYPDFQSPLRTLLQIQHLHSEWGRDCKWHTSEKCQSPKFTGAGSKNNRQYQADLVVWRALMDRCPRATSPQHADVFVIPYLYGSSGSQLWGEYFRAAMRQQLASLRKNGTQLLHQLPHLNAKTAARHVLLMTLDVEFADPTFQGAAPPLLANALLVHLGDDHVPNRAKLQARTKPLRQALTVPIRVSQWCPLGFPPPERPKQRLLLANINPGRHKTRAVLAAALMKRARDLGVESRVLFPQGSTSGSGGGSGSGRGSGSTGGSGSISGSTGGSGSGATNATHSSMLAPREAAEAALSSCFCLCPTGDSKGFTARFYFAIAHRCIPVRYDGFHRRLLPPPRPASSSRSDSPPGTNAEHAAASERHHTAYPFSHRIDWSRVVYEAPDHSNGTLLDALLSVPHAEVEARLDYLRHVAPMLMYHGSHYAEGSGETDGGSYAGGRSGKSRTAGVPWTPLDPPQLLIEQLELKFIL